MLLQSVGRASLPSPAPEPVTPASVPSGPTLLNQQLPVTAPMPPSSHQKSKPFFDTPRVGPTVFPNPKWASKGLKPRGTRPSWLS